MATYIDTTQEAGKEFYQNFHDKGKIVMLNLLKFKPKADYSNLDHLKPETEVTGKEAYQLYMEATLPELEKAGSRIMYYGKSNSFLIGPESEQWDAILIVEHESVARFMAFAQNKDYLRTAGHRTAALEDSRLLPSSEIK
ncbi:MAG: DUF1330 domain-containing protein [Bacteroidia bacterium]|nr:DUF1330 domain-containing protein [Bacteroidia bacterium]